jgi:hypothetical protein
MRVQDKRVYMAHCTRVAVRYPADQALRRRKSDWCLVTEKDKVNRHRNAKHCQDK